MELPAPGDTFYGKYKLHEILGRGGFAAVYRATDLEIGRDVAIKVLAPSEDGYAEGMAKRFLREARVIASLRDPHTITMFEFGQEAGLLFMVTEYISGTDLSALSKRGPLGEDATIHILQQVLQSLREAHAAGVFHRDIKPANIIVYTYMDDPYRAKLLDFGIAKATDGGDGADLTSAGAMIGTPRYMSPEQIYGETLTPASDIYSLGLVAFEMLSGGPAITGRSTKEMMMQQLSREPVTLSPSVPVSAGLRAIVNRMTMREPTDRFATAEAVLHALETLIARAPTHRLPPGAFAAAVANYQGAEGARGEPQGQPRPPSGTPNPHGPPPNAPYTPYPPPAGVDRTPHTRPSTGQYTGVRPPPTGQHTGLHAPGTNPPARAWSSVALGAVGVGVGVLVVVGVVKVLSTPEPAPVVPNAPGGGGLVKTTNPEPEPNHVVEPDVGTSLDATLADTDANVADASADAASPQTGGCGVPTNWRRERRINVPLSTTTRRLIAYIPKSYDENVEHPVVLLFHKGFNDASWLLKDSGIMPVADKHNFVVLSLDASNSTSPWQGRDRPFVDAALDLVGEELCLDRSRVFAIGHGAGGDFLRTFNCEYPFAGFATVGSGEVRGERRCANDPPVPYIRMVGMQDKYVPINGGSGCIGGNHQSLEQVNAKWRDTNQCEGAQTTWHKRGDDVCYTWACDAPFVSCELQGGHDWPDSTPEKFELPGCPHPPPDFPMSETIWKFFAEQQARPPK